MKSIMLSCSCEVVYTLVHAETNLSFTFKLVRCKKKVTEVIAPRRTFKHASTINGSLQDCIFC